MPGELASQPHVTGSRQVWPSTRQQLCWVHKTARVLSALPKRLPPRAKQLIHGISYGQTRAEAAQAAKVLAELAADPKAVVKVTRDLDALTAFFDFPAEHWKHLRTTNPIESTFATVRLRTRVTRGGGSREAATAMAYKLLDAAQQRWRRVDGHDLVALVRAGATFIDGKHVEREDARTEEERDDNDQERAA